MYEKNMRDVLIFGAGNHLPKIFGEIVDYGCNILAVMDNNPERQGEYIVYHQRRLQIVSPAEAVNYSFDMIIVAISLLSYQYVVVKQLYSLGVPVNKIYGWGNGEPVPYPIVNSELSISDMGCLFFDVSSISQRDAGTGIQRVANNLYHHLSIHLESPLIPARWFGGIITSYAYEKGINQETCPPEEKKIVFTSKDKLLLADLTLLEIGDFFTAAQSGGATSFTIVYDLLPLSIPEAFEERTKGDFENWVRQVLQMSDHVLCISQTVADELVDYYRKQGFQREKPLYVHYFHLGFDISSEKGNVRSEIKEFLCNRKSFLMVGTVEPRKNHALAVRAMREVWRRRRDEPIGLLVLGHDGWKNEAFKDLMQEDEVVRHVLWIRDASDAELSWAYQNADALLYPSKNEGFGLPIVEAAYYRLPILCSDIPILHELTGGNASYFSVDNMAAIRDAVLKWLGESVHSDSGGIDLYSWQDCAQEVLDILEGKTEPYAVLSR